MSESKKHIRIPLIKKILANKKPEELPEFVTRLYLGELDAELDAVITDDIIEKELRTLSFICVMAYHEAILKDDRMKPHLAVYKLKAAALRPYFRANKGFTKRFAYYFYLKFGDSLSRKDILNLAGSLGVGEQHFYQEYTAISSAEMQQEENKHIVEEAKKMLSYMDFA